MDAVKFFKTANRLCKNRSCRECPVCKDGVCMVMHAFRKDDNDDLVKSIEETVSKVEQWAKDNPVKTRQSELLKLFPNTKIDSGVIIFCPRNFLPEVERDEYCKGDKSCIECRKEYWLTEVSE